jgi:hypothetical protein
MTCPTKEEKIIRTLDLMPEGHIFYTKDLAKSCNIGSHEAGKRLPRTGKAVKVSLKGEPCRWMRRDVVLPGEVRV